MSEKVQQASEVAPDGDTYTLEVHVRHLLAEIYNKAVEAVQNEAESEEWDDWEYEQDSDSEEAEEYKDEKPLPQIESQMVDGLDDIDGEEETGQQIVNEKAPIAPALSIDEGVAELLYKVKEDSQQLNRSMGTNQSERSGSTFSLPGNWPQQDQVLSRGYESSSMQN